MKCNICNQDFDPANLVSVFQHEHKELPIPEFSGSKRIIHHASEIYPNCSPQFAAGVHSFINKDEKPTIGKAHEEFIQGYWAATSNIIFENILLQP